MQPGIYPGMSDADYRATKAVSCSTLKRFAEAPAKALVPSKDSAAMNAGRLIHSALLEPHLFEARYAWTAIDRRGTKAWEAAEAEAAAESKTLLKRDDWCELATIRDAVMAHPTARELLGPGLIPEASVFWRDEATGMPCRGRVDGLRPQDRLIVDLKTTVDASPDDFARGAANWRHHWQEAFYRHGVKAAPGGFEADRFIFIALEREPPFLIGIYELSPGAVAQGKREVMRALGEYAECERTGIWPGYSPDVVMVDLPAWALDEEFVQ
jgi:exodeoxyribonuclease VIII